MLQTLIKRPRYFTEPFNVTLHTAINVDYTNAFFFLKAGVLILV